MKDIGTKRLLFTLLTGALMLIFGIYVIPKEYHFLSLLLSLLCAVGCQFGWMVLYDKYDPKADMFGIGFAKNRFPVFVENQGRMNFLAFSTYKWILICIILLYCGNK